VVPLPSAFTRQTPQQSGGGQILVGRHALGSARRPCFGSCRPRRTGVPLERACDRPTTITGVGKRAAECIIARDRGGHEPVPDRREPRFVGGDGPGEQHHRGKRRSGKTTKSDVWLRDILTQCAWGKPEP